MFNRINAEEFIAEMIAAHTAAKEAEAPENPVQPIAEQIEIGTFAQSDLRVAEVIACEKVKKSSKLLCFKLFDGIGERQVLSGIAKWYQPEELVGKKVFCVVNLKPVKLCGLESCGMICSAEGADGTVTLLIADDSIAAGSRLC